MRPQVRIPLLAIAVSACAVAQERAEATTDALTVQIAPPQLPANDRSEADALQLSASLAAEAAAAVELLRFDGLDREAPPDANPCRAHHMFWLGPLLDLPKRLDATALTNPGSDYQVAQVAPDIAAKAWSRSSVASNGSDSASRTTMILFGAAGSLPFQHILDSTTSVFPVTPGLYSDATEHRGLREAQLTLTTEAAGPTHRIVWYARQHDSDDAVGPSGTSPVMNHDTACLSTLLVGPAPVLHQICVLATYDGYDLDEIPARYQSRKTLLTDVTASLAPAGGVAVSIRSTRESSHLDAPETVTTHLGRDARLIRQGDSCQIVDLVETH